MFVFASFVRSASAEASLFCQKGPGLSNPAWPSDGTQFGYKVPIAVGCCKFAIPTGAEKSIRFCAESSGNNTDDIGTFLDEDINGMIQLSEGQTCTPRCGNTVSEQFNLVGDCTGSYWSPSDDNTPTDEPATCEDACSAGATCVQEGEVETNPCVGQGFSGPFTYGYKLLRKCQQTSEPAAEPFPIGNTNSKAISPNEAPFAYTCKNVSANGWSEYLPAYTCDVSMVGATTSFTTGSLWVVLLSGTYVLHLA